MKRTICALVVGLLSGGGAALAEDVVPGGIYRGPTQLQVPGLDVAFRLPAGFTGKASDEGMLIGHESKPGLILATVRAEVSVADIRAELAGPIALDDATVLQLAGKIRVRGDRIVANYRGQGVAGYAVVRRNAAGRAVGFIAAAKPKGLAGLKKSVDRMAKSVRFVRSDQSAYWRQFLADKRWVYMSTGGGSSTRTRVTLCANGRFSYYGSSNIFSHTQGIVNDTTVSGLSRGGYEGTWKVYGPKSAGRLALTRDGESEPAVLNVRRKGTRIFVDGTRYINDTRSASGCE